MEATVTGTDRISHVAQAAAQARERQGQTALPGMLPLAINNKEHGMIHRLSEATITLPREQRRSRCGWRAGAVTANARFANTSVWPLPGITSTRLCMKCFPHADAALSGTVLRDDPISE